MKDILDFVRFELRANIDYKQLNTTFCFLHMGVPIRWTVPLYLSEHAPPKLCEKMSLQAKASYSRFIFTVWAFNRLPVSCTSPYVTHSWNDLFLEDEVDNKFISYNSHNIDAKAWAIVIEVFDLGSCIEKR